MSMLSAAVGAMSIQPPGPPPSDRARTLFQHGFQRALTPPAAGQKIELLNDDYRANSLRSRDLLPLLMADLLENLQLPLDLKSIDPTVSRRL